MSQTEKQAAESWGDKPVRNHLVFAERPLIVQTGLKDLFGEHEAELIQHIIYCREAPFYDKLVRREITLAEEEGRIYVHIPVRLMFDPWTGYLRHFSEITYRRTLASCRAQGVLDTKTRLFEEDRNDNSNWFAIIHEVFDPLTTLYADFWGRITAARQHALINKLRPPSEKQEAETREEMHARLTEIWNGLINDGFTHPEAMTDIAKRLKKAAAKKGSVESPDQNDRATLSEGEPIILLPSTMSKRDGGITQNDRDDHNKKSGPLYKKVQSSKKIPPTATGPSAEDEKSIDLDPGSNSNPFALSESLEVTPAVKDVAARLMELAGELQMHLSANDAQTLALRFPETRMDAAALKARLGPDYALANLQHAIPKHVRNDLINPDPDFARWRLIVWPAFEESTPEFHTDRKNWDRKIGKPYGQVRCFLSKFEEDEVPPRRWLRGLINGLVREREEAEWRRDKAAAEAKRAELMFGLNEPELAGLKSNLRTLVENRFNNTFDGEYHTKARQMQRAEVWVLVQPDLEEQLAKLAAPASASDVPPFLGSGEAELTDFDRDRLRLHVDGFVRQLEAGELTAVNLEQEIAVRKNLAPRAAAWLTEEVKQAFATVQEERSRKAAGLWETLKEPQRNALEFRVQAELRAQFPGRSIEPGSSEWIATRARLLSSTSVIAKLMTVKQEQRWEDLWQIQPVEPVEQTTIELHTGAIVELLRGGKLLAVDVSAHLEAESPDLSAEERAEVAERALREMYGEAA